MRTNNIETVSNIQGFDNKTVKKESKNTVKEEQSILSQNRKKTLGKDISKKIKEEYKEFVEDTVKDMNDIVEKVREGLQFRIHEDTERLMIQVIDVKTREVIKELPPEDMLDLSARIQEMVGILIDEKV